MTRVDEFHLDEVPRVDGLGLDEVPGYLRLESICKNN